MDLDLDGWRFLDLFSSKVANIILFFLDQLIKDPFGGWNRQFVLLSFDQTEKIFPSKVSRNHGEVTAEEALELAKKLEAMLWDSSALKLWFNKKRLGLGANF